MVIAITSWECIIPFATINEVITVISIYYIIPFKTIYYFTFISSTNCIIIFVTVNYIQNWLWSFINICHINSDCFSIRQLSIRDCHVKIIRGLYIFLIWNI